MATTFSALEGQLGINVGGWKKGFQQAEGTARGFTKRVGALFNTIQSTARGVMNVGTRMANNLGQAAGAISLVGSTAIGVSSKVAASFEQNMARVEALLGPAGAIQKNMDSLSNKAKDMGASTSFSATQASEAMQFFALAGFKVDEILTAMEPTLNLAAAGMIEIGQAADVTAKIMKGMGLEAEDLTNVSDVLTKAMTTANTDLLQLGEAFKQVGPIAKVAKQSLEETTAEIQVLSNAGIQGGSAGAGLKNILSQLSQESANVKKVFGSLNVEIKDAAGNLRPMPDIIDDFNQALVDQGREAEKAGLVMNAFGLRGGPSMAVLLDQGGEALRQMTKDLTDPGVAARIAERQMNTFKGSTLILKSALEGLAITIGEAVNPGIRENIVAFTQWLGAHQDVIASGVIQFWETLGMLINEATAATVRLWEATEPVREQMAVLVEMGGRLKNFLVDLFASMPTWVQDILKFAGAMLAVNTGLLPILRMLPIVGTAISALAAVIGGPLTVVIVGVAVAIGVLMANWERISEFIQTNFGPVIEQARQMFFSLVNIVKAVALGVFEDLKAIWQQVAPLAMQAFQQVKSVILTVWNTIGPILIKLATTWIKSLKTVWSALAEAIGKVIATAKQFWSEHGEQVKNILATIAKVIGFVIGLWIKWQMVLMKVAAFVLPLVIKYITSLIQIGFKLLGVLTDVWGWIDEHLMPILKTLAQVIMKRAVEAFNRIKAVAVGVWEVLKEGWKLFKALIGPIVEVGKEIWASLVVVFNQLKEVVEDVIGWVNAIIRKLFGLNKATKESGEKQSMFVKIIKAVAAVLKFLVQAITFVIKPATMLAKIVINVLGAAFRSVLHLIGGMGKAMRKLFTGDFKGAKDAVEDTLGAIKKAFTDIPAKIRGANKDLAQTTRDQTTMTRQHAESELGIFHNTQQRLRGAAVANEKDALERRLASMRIRNRKEREAIAERERMERESEERRKAEVMERARQEAREDNKRFRENIPTGEVGEGQIGVVSEAEFERRMAAREKPKKRVDQSAAGVQQLRALSGGAGGGAIGGDGAALGGGGGPALGGGPGSGGFLRFAEAAAAVKSLGKDVSGSLTNSTAKWLTQMDTMFGKGGKQLDKFLKGLEGRATKSAGAVIKSLRAMGVQMGKGQIKFIQGNRKQVAKLMGQLKNASGRQRAEIIAQIVQLQTDFAFQMERMKIAGNKTWEEMTEVQKNQLEQQRRQLEKQAKAMQGVLGELGQAFGGPGQAGIGQGGGGVAGGGRRGGVRQGGLLGQNAGLGLAGGGVFGRGGILNAGSAVAALMNPGALVQGFFNAATQGIGDAFSGAANFANFLGQVEDPVRQMELAIQNTTTQLNLMRFNFDRFTAVSGNNIAIQRELNAQKQVELKLERQKAELERRKEEAERARLAEFRRLSGTRAEAARRKAEERALFGPDVDINTGDNRPIDLGFGASSNATAARNGDSFATNNALNIQMTFTEEVTPEKADQLLDAIDDAASRRGIDTQGSSALRGQRPEQAFQGRFAKVGR